MERNPPCCSALDDFLAWTASIAERADCTDLLSRTMSKSQARCATMQTRVSLVILGLARDIELPEDLPTAVHRLPLT